MKNNNSLYKILRAYLLTAVISLCVIFVLAASAQAGSNTQKISTAEQSSVLALAHQNEKILINIDEEKAAAINLPPPQKAEFIFSFSPLYWFLQSFLKLIN